MCEQTECLDTVSQMQYVSDKTIDESVVLFTGLATSDTVCEAWMDCRTDSRTSLATRMDLTGTCKAVCYAYCWCTHYEVNFPIEMEEYKGNKPAYCSLFTTKKLLGDKVALSIKNTNPEKMFWHKSQIGSIGNNHVLLFELRCVGSMFQYIGLGTCLTGDAAMPRAFALKESVLLSACKKFCANLDMWNGRECVGISFTFGLVTTKDRGLCVVYVPKLSKDNVPSQDWSEVKYKTVGDGDNIVYAAGGSNVLCYKKMQVGASRKDHGCDGYTHDRMFGQGYETTGYRKEQSECYKNAGGDQGACISVANTDFYGQGTKWTLGTKEAPQTTPNLPTCKCNGKFASKPTGFNGAPDCKSLTKTGSPWCFADKGACADAAESTVITELSPKGMYFSVTACKNVVNPPVIVTARATLPPTFTTTFTTRAPVDTVEPQMSVEPSATQQAAATTRPSDTTVVQPVEPGPNQVVLVFTSVNYEQVVSSPETVKSFKNAIRDSLIASGVANESILAIYVEKIEDPVTRRVRRAGVGVRARVLFRDRSSTQHVQRQSDNEGIRIVYNGQPHAGYTHGRSNDDHGGGKGAMNVMIGAAAILIVILAVILVMGDSKRRRIAKEEHSKDRSKDHYAMTPMVPLTQCTMVRNSHIVHRSPLSKWCQKSGF